MMNKKVSKSKCVELIERALNLQAGCPQMIGLTPRTKKINVVYLMRAAYWGMWYLEQGQPNDHEEMLRMLLCGLYDLDHNNAYVTDAYGIDLSDLSFSHKYL
jgi:hypothetical protein